MLKFFFFFFSQIMLRQPYGIAAGQSSPPGNFSGISHRSLFKTSFIQAQRQHQQSMPVFDQAETEIWRSETFLQVGHYLAFLVTN